MTQQRVMSKKKILKRALNCARGKYYAQYAEDVVIKKWLTTFYPNRQYFYLDIGCGRSKYTSNTWLLYRDGAWGYCYDANPRSCKKFKRKRPRDIVINSAITGEEHGTVKFSVFNLPELSTIHEENVAAMINQGFCVKRTISVPSVTIEQILSDVNKTEIDLLSLDVEGKEYEILKRIDLNRYRIKIICIEVVDYKTGGNNEVSSELVHYMRENGYSIICNTGVNIVFAIDDIKGE